MKRLSKNILALFFADVVRRLLGFVAVAYLARTLGTADFGLVNVGFAVLAYGMTLSAAGFPTFGTKSIAQGASPELIGQVFGTRLISTAAMVGVTASIAFTAIPDKSTALLLVVFVLPMLPQIFFVDWFFQGKESMRIVAAARILQAAVYLLVVLLCVRTQTDITWVAAGAIAGECAASLLLYRSFRKQYPGVSIRIRPSLSLFKQSLPLAVGVFLATAVGNYPQIALGIFSSASAVGVFSAAGKLVYFLMMGDRILVLVLLPASARIFGTSPEGMSLMHRDATQWILLLGLPLAAGGMFVAGDVIALIYGPAYALSAIVLRVLVWLFFFTMLHTINIAGLIGSGNEKKYGTIMIVTAALYFVFVSLGALLFGPVGAALGVVVSEGASVVLCVRALRSIVPLKPPVHIFRIFGAVVLMALCIAAAGVQGVWQIMLAGSISYTVCIVLFRVVTWNDVRLLLARFV